MTMASAIATAHDPTVLVDWVTDGANTPIGVTPAYALTGSGYPGRLSCESETMYVTGGDGTTEISVIRGQDGTDAVAHAFGTTIADANLGTGGGATPTLAEVLVAGNTTGETNIVTPMASLLGDTGNGEFDIYGAAGIKVALYGGDASDASPGATAGLYGGHGDSSNSSGALVEARGGAANGIGGLAVLVGGASSFGSGAAGGDVYIAGGAGDGAGRNGLIFLNLPTSDPAVAGALWNDTGTVKVSA